jgi:hypothetical protein
MVKVDDTSSTADAPADLAEHVRQKLGLYDQLEQILSALPVIESRRDTVGAEAKFLCLVFRSPPDGVSPKEAERELRAWVGLRPVTAKQAERELLALVNQSSKLRLHISKMSKAALDEMGVDRASVEPAELNEIEEAARRALRVRAQSAIGPTGRPREGRAERIASAAASVFERLTGKPSTLSHSEGVAYGPFLDFLNAVLEACRITASAEAQFKAFQRKYRPSTW